MTPDDFFARFSVKCFYHFTDARNLPLIKAQGGLLPMRELRGKGVVPPAPGGSETSRHTDQRNGMDAFVHLCFFNQNPMEFRAREDGRIMNTVFLEISREVLRFEGVRLTAAMSNQKGVTPLTLAEACDQLDFAAIYGRMDLKDPEQLSRVLAARKYEILIPAAISLDYIRNLSRGR